MSYKIQLTQEEIKELKSRMKQQMNSKIYRRLLAIDLKNNKESNDKIAKLLSVRAETITIWTKIYLNHGLEGLCKLNYSTKLSKLEPYKDELKELLNKKLVPKIAYLQDYFESKHSLTLSRWAFSDYLKKRLNYTFKKQD